MARLRDPAEDVLVECAARQVNLPNPLRRVFSWAISPPATPTPLAIQVLRGLMYGIEYIYIHTFFAPP